ncbi:uncharacterized protein LOC114529377 isoform X2 [Dendronephthya gigantea]|nr:uncharacterized protein LOC114529377 isoform X2 [Dendronephthya gigantea]
MYGMGDSDHMDYEPTRLPQELTDQQAVYKELGISNPNNDPKNPLPLLDICASKIALNFPFAYIEDRHPPVPENVQLKVISYSFPQDMQKIKRYCSLNNGSSGEFDKAIKNLKSVKDLTQIGFHLSANVETRSYREVWHGGPPGKKAPYLYVNVKFDRGKIIDTNCPCETNSSWCYHVIAVCLCRIFQPEKCEMKPPLSDSLNNLTTYAQLRTFTQYLIAEFSDRRIVESAQSVLDRMIKPQIDDAINETWGAPDPTAGPGFEELAQWLICEEGLKTRCTVLIQNSDVTEGCWATSLGDSDDQFASVWDRWRSSQIEKPVIEDYFNNLEAIPGNILFSYNHYKKTYSREKSQEITKFLKNCEELLIDDFGYSLKAVQTFTVQLMDNIEERNKRNSYRVGREKFESNLHLGCIPRPQDCWLFRDQLARLWRLLVLNPSISARNREEIFTTLEVLEAKLHPSDGKKQFIEWDSPQHIQQLKNLSWESLQLSDDPFKSNSTSEISVLKSTAIEYGKNLTKMNFSDTSGQFPYPVELRCGDFVSSVTMYCYFIEALVIYGKKEQAVDLAMNLALAIIRYYSAWLEGSSPSDVQNTLCVDHDEKHENETGKKAKGKGKKRQTRKRGRSGSKKTGDETVKFSPNEMLFDQTKGIIPITSIAYLMFILDENQDLLAEMLKLVKLRGLGLSEDELMECDDVTNDAKSLIFRIGVVGVAMPKIQAASLQIQVEWFNWDVYVSQKLLQCTPSTGDVEFLRMFTLRMHTLREFGFHPSHVLVTNLFHHAYKPGGRNYDEDISIVLGTISALPWKSNSMSLHYRTFLECLRRHWVKLVEIVLCRVSASSIELSDALKCVCSATAMFGSTDDDCSDKTSRKGTARNKKSTESSEHSGKSNSVAQNKKIVQDMLIEKVVANLYLAYVLVSHADSLKQDTASEKRVVASRKTSPKLVNLKIIMGKWRFPTEQQQRLYETAVTLACRSFAVKNFTYSQLDMINSSHDYNFIEFMQRSLKWMCSISEKIGVKAFDIIMERQRLQTGSAKCFNDDEIIKICTTMLESDQKDEDLVWVRVREALLTLICPRSQSKISEILNLFRVSDKEQSSKQVLLVPAICKELLSYIPGSSLEESTKMNHLSRAMITMHGLCKKLENEDSGESLEGVKELFAESSADKPGTSDDNQETLDPNLQLCFDLAIESIKHINDNFRLRSGFEVRRTFENMCNVITFVAKKASSGSVPEDAKVKADPFEEVYINRFVEALCNNVKDYLLLTDFFFELSSRLLALPQHGSFGRDRVLLSDDLNLGLFCQSCSSLSVLLKRCIAGLVAITQGDDMEKFIKDSLHDNPGYCKTRAKNAKFYCGSTLVNFLEVLKRLMSISQEDDFEPFSYRLASRHAITKAGIDELENKVASSPVEEPAFSENQLISSLLLRRMFSPAFACFDYDSDNWMY